MPKVVAEKNDWIKVGFGLFAKYGEAGIVVDKMVRILKCNRSSFYWHFKTKKAFIKEVVDFWVEFDTEQIILLTEKSGTASEKFEALVKAVFRKDPQMDFVFHIKRYARKDEAIQKIIDEVDNKRITYTASILSALGYTSEEALIKARIFYKYLIGHHEMMRYKKQSPNYVMEVMNELEAFISINRS